MNTYSHDTIFLYNPTNFGPHTFALVIATNNAIILVQLFITIYAYIIYEVRFKLKNTRLNPIFTKILFPL